MKKLFSVVLAVVLMLMVFSPISGTDLKVAAQGTVYMFDNIGGGTSSTYSPSHRMTVTLFGRFSCYNSMAVLDTCIEMGLTGEGIRVVFVDVDGNNKQKVAEQASAYAGSGVEFCYATKNAVNSAIDFYFGGDRSYDLPLVSFVDNQNRVVETSEGYIREESISQLVHSEILNGDTLGNLKGTDEVALSVSGQENYDYAYSVLSQLNQLRSSLGLSTLTMDKTLLSVAMKRAAEIGVYYSHTRPNGESCFSICDVGYAGENIAIGYTQPQDVMNGWKNSSGHYLNMTNSGFSSVGIGCFETSSGVYCWVQFFSDSKGTAVSKSGTQYATHTFAADIEKLDLKMRTNADPKDLFVGESFSVLIENRNKGFRSAFQILDTSLFRFSSSDPSVVSVSQQGDCTIKKAGHATVTATLKSDSRVSFTYKCHAAHLYPDECYPKNGWIAEGGKWYYYENDRKITNDWRKDTGGWLYLGSDGTIKTNSWAKDSVGWCYLDAKGYMVKSGWIQDGGKWYFLNQNGYMLANAWQQDANGWVYVGSNGAMLTNAWAKDGSGWTYLGADGYMVKSRWIQDGGKWYLLNKNGYMVANSWQKDANGWVYLGANGAMLTNAWAKDGHGWTYLGANGYMVKNGWVKDKGNWYYLNKNGYMVANTWQKDGDHWTYLGANGAMLTNAWAKAGNGWSYLGANGYMVKNTWIKDGGKWYYLDANGYMVKGKRTIDGKTYTFNSEGVWVA